MVKSRKSKKQLLIDEELGAHAQMLADNSVELVWQAKQFFKPKTKLIKQTDAFATELSTEGKRKVVRSWNMVIGEIGQYGTVVDYTLDGGFKQTPVLRAHGIRACSRCGMLQPQETLYCKACGSL